MSTHIFTLRVDCKDEDQYLSVVNVLQNTGEIIDEENDFNE